MARRFLSALAVAALALGVAACGDGGDGPVATPPPALGIDTSDGGGTEGNPSDGGGVETEDPTAASPDVPAPDPADYPGMDEETPEGAEQSLRYYIAVVYWGYQTGDTETLETLYTDNCERCKTITAEIYDIGESSSFWDDAPIIPVSSAYHDSEDFDLEASYGFRIGAHKEPAAGGTDSTEIEETPYTAVAGFNWASDAWLVDTIILAESQHAE